jgi:undecaprenyl phosphate N,N'-diacetylbacillosamine 1-phosphate transferase
MSKQIQLGIKQGLDFLFSVFGTVLLIPLFIVFAIVIKLDSPGPVFFKQTRVGLGGRTFPAYKFRSMVQNAEDINLTERITEDKYGVIQDDPRITRVGKFLRKTSLDELPQILNILRGEMSFIGPRPDIVPQANCYTEWERRRLEMKPGISGWAQVNGRNQLSWPEKFKLDIWYIDHYSLGLDLRILLKTSKVVFEADGIYTEGEDQMNVERNPRS